MRMRAADFIDFNSRMSIKKGAVATKVAMDKLQPFTKRIPEVEKAAFSGGSKFRNGDTIMARITPCRFVKHFVQREIQRRRQVFLWGRARPRGA